MADVLQVGDTVKIKITSVASPTMVIDRLTNLNDIVECVWFHPSSGDFRRAQFHLKSLIKAPELVEK